MIYIERISFYSLSFILLPKLLINLFTKRINFKIIFFYGKSFLLKFYKKKLVKYDFEIRDVRLDKGECVLSKIKRYDLPLLLNHINSLEFLKDINNNFLDSENINKYIYKSLLGPSVSSEFYNSQVLESNILLIQKVYHHINKLKINNCDFYFEDRPWFDIYQQYAGELGINLIRYKDYSFQIPDFRGMLKNFFWLSTFLRRIRNVIKFSEFINMDKSYKSNNKPKLFFESLGEFNLQKDGKNSDFFFYLYSDLDSSYISSIYSSKYQRDTLIDEGIQPIFMHNFPKNRFNNYNIKLPTVKSDQSNLETSLIKSTIDEYCTIRSKWEPFLLKNKIKLFLTWYKFGNKHIAIHDAVNSVGGISAIWDRSFEGEKSPYYCMVADINFCFSNFNPLNHNKIDRRVSHSVITGYLRDYSRNYMSEKAKLIRKKMKRNGAELIVAVFDQNSVDEYSHKREAENYYHIINALFEERWLGVIFKPKKPATLRTRLGPDISKLIDEAIGTGRCILLEDSGDYQSNVPVITAAEISDICIHGSLYAGTAALECALTNKPTLLLDTVGHPYNRLNELNTNNIIFQSWPSIIESLSQYQKHKDKMKNFGNWSNYLDSFDPFNDGKGADRMGSYLQYVMEGFEKKLSKENILEYASDLYAKKWGSQHIIRS